MTQDPGTGWPLEKPPRTRHFRWQAAAAPARQPSKVITNLPVV